MSDFIYSVLDMQSVHPTTHTTDTEVAPDGTFVSTEEAEYINSNPYNIGTDNVSAPIDADLSWTFGPLHTEPSADGGLLVSGNFVPVKGHNLTKSSRISR